MQFNFQPSQAPSPFSPRIKFRSAIAQSEATFRRLLEDANYLIWSSQLDSTLTYLSPQFKVMFGYDIDAWLGRSFMPLVHPEDVSRLDAFLWEVVETGEQCIGAVFRHRRRDGRWSWVSSNFSLVRDTDGNAVGLQGVLRDISNRKSGEATKPVEDRPLRTTDLLFEQFFQKSADAMLLLEKDRLIDCNWAAVQMLRCQSKAELLALLAANLLAAKLTPEFQPDGQLSSQKAKEMMTIALCQGSYRFEWTYQRMTGEPVQLEVLFTPLEFDQRSLLHVTWRQMGDRV
ncbi:MAG: PAS domain S-box protein [Oculatellaceae cyanobacterium Prado106]|jgi:PAS domain S-box-containing protein|nr:PAS domain S-box protein [Oculatellaceae cyanobacterium Prado106]